MASARANRTPKKRETFLNTLIECGNVTQSAEAAGIPRRTLYDWRAGDPDFAAAWDAALDLGADALEDEARRRAIAGSDVLLIFLLKGARPEKYKDRATIESKVEVTSTDVRELSTDELNQRIAALSGAAGATGKQKQPDPVH